MGKLYAIAAGFRDDPVALLVPREQFDYAVTKLMERAKRCNGPVAESIGPIDAFVLYDIYDQAPRLPALDEKSIITVDGHHVQPDMEMQEVTLVLDGDKLIVYAHPAYSADDALYAVLSIEEVGNATSAH